MKKQKDTAQATKFSACDRAQNPASDAWMAFIAPGDTFHHPREVLAHQYLSNAEKRAVLAWRASDIHAVNTSPWLRCLPGKASEAVPVGDVFAALAELDADYVRDLGKGPKAVPSRRRRRDPFPEPHWLRGSWRDDDDDPPPCPATIMPRPKTPGGVIAAFAAAA